MSEPTEAIAIQSAHSCDGAAEVVRHIAHELRQPLSTIESIAYYLEIVLPRGETRSRRQLAKLQQQIHQINWILSDAIHLTQATPMRPQLLDLDEVISRSISEWALDESVEVRLTLSFDLPPVRIDLEQVQHMLRNLLFYLWRSSGTERAIAISTRSEGAEVVLEISSACPETVFAELRCLANPAGAGVPAPQALPLASALRIAEAHGARIEARRGAAEGVLLTVAFPQAA